MAVPLHYSLHHRGLIYWGLMATIKLTGESRSRSQFLPRNSVLKITALLSQTHAYSPLMFTARQWTSQLLAFETLFSTEHNFQSFHSCLFHCKFSSSTMLFSPVPVLFVPLIYFLRVALFCCASQDFFVDCLHFENFLPEIVPKVQVVTRTLSVSFLYHVSLPPSPSFSWPCALQVLCD